MDIGTTGRDPRDLCYGKEVMVYAHIVISRKATPLYPVKHPIYDTWIVREVCQDLVRILFIDLIKKRKQGSKANQVNLQHREPSSIPLILSNTFAVLPNQCQTIHRMLFDNLSTEKQDQSETKELPEISQ